jgi:hypothetical protein
MERSLFTEEHETLRKAFRHFVEREVVQILVGWRELGHVDREVWR